MHENPKAGQGDGAGFRRLRAEQTRREAMYAILRRSHTSGNVWIDQVREYAGIQVTFFRHELLGYEYARVAIFKTNPSGGMYCDQDIVANVGNA